MDAALGITGFAIEDFEDNTLLPGLSYIISNPDGGLFSSLPNVFLVSSFAGTANNQWDGSAVLLSNSQNGFPSEGIRGRTITFNINPHTTTFGIGLSNFQSVLSPVDQFPVTDHEIFVNGVNLGRLEDLAALTWVPGRTVRNSYLRLDATGAERISSVKFVNLGQTGETDLLAFDHIAIQSVPEPTSLLLMFCGVLALALRGRRQVAKPAN